MISENAIANRKKMAASTQRHEALAAILPHALAAVAASDETRTMAGARVRAEVTFPCARAGGIEIDVQRSAHGAYVRVRANGREKLAARIDCAGHTSGYLDGRVQVFRWERGPWEQQLFDAFPAVDGTDEGLDVYKRIALPTSRFIESQ